MNKLERAARQVVDNGVQGTYAKYYSVPPADFEALREALTEQEDEIYWIETNKALAKEIIELKKQAGQEPVGEVLEGGYEVRLFDRLPKETPLYAAPLAKQDTHATHVVRTKDLTELLGVMVGMANYIDKLGGDSKKYRAVIEKFKEKNK